MLLPSSVKSNITKYILLCPWKQMELLTPVRGWWSEILLPQRRVVCLSSTPRAMDSVRCNILMLEVELHEFATATHDGDEWFASRSVV